MESIIKDNEEFLDRVAIATMEFYLRRKAPDSISDATAVSKICYKQALAMLEVKLGLVEMVKSTELFRKQNKQVKIKYGRKHNSPDGGLGNDGD